MNSRWKKRVFAGVLLIAAIIFWWITMPGKKAAIVNGGGEIIPNVDNPADAPKTLSQQQSMVLADNRPPAKNMDLPSGHPVLEKVKSKGLSEKEIAAIRSEMKISLAANYGAQKSFFSEYGRYSTDFNAVGYSPEGNQFGAKFGFLQPFSPKVLTGNEDPRFMNSDSFFNSDYAFREGLVYKASAAEINLQDLIRYCSSGCTANERGFEMITAAVLVPGNPPDVWIINEKKELRHVQDGLVKQ